MDNKMTFEIVGYSVDKFSPCKDYSADNMFRFGGREAGICYATEGYFDNRINNDEQAMKRANTIVNSGHHSPFDHGSISIIISNIPKILAMVLNSTEFYTTSEKSARYTHMEPNTIDEKNAYEKWTGIFEEQINALNIDKLTSKDVEKLSIENARYMLSVFTPTFMGYTTTFRQYSYMADWLYNLAENLMLRPNSFNNRLYPYCVKLADYFKSITDAGITDNKNGYFEFLPKQYGKDGVSNKEYFYDMYQTSYLASFASLAQAQRHRTIHYEMEFSGDKPGEYGCFVPPIIKGTDLEKEWLSDFDKVKNEFPQATYVKVLEQGRTHCFFNKCKERLCGRAQLETMMQTADTMKKIIDNKDNLSNDLKNELNGCTNNGKVIARCGFDDFKCTGNCIWGCKDALTRKI